MESLSVDRGGFTLAAWRTGRGAETAPAVVGIHEGATSSAVWHPLAEAIEPRATVAAYDRRGWGRSGAPPDYRRTTIGEQTADLLAVLDALAVDRAVLCGSGIGAVVALEAAVRQPDRVAAVVLVEPPLFALVPE